MMVGRKVLLRVEKAPANPGDVVLKVDNLRVVRDGVERVKGVSFRSGRERSSASRGWRATGRRNSWRCSAA
jgi:hypothetical protein